MKSAIIVGPADPIVQNFGIRWYPRVMRPACHEDVTGQGYLSEESCVEKLDEIAARYMVLGHHVIRVATMGERDAIIAFVHGAMKSVLCGPLAALEIHGHDRPARSAA